MTQLTSRQTPPLDGLTVLDLSRLFPGGHCTLVLSDLGARVIKIEEPGVGDFYRASDEGPLLGDGYHEALSRGKESVALNLKDAEARTIFLKLVKEADIIVESFRPGRMRKLGLGYDVLAAINPRLIFCSLTGYGQYGPYAQKAGHDLNYISLAGLLGPSKCEGLAPQIPEFQVADLAGGALYAVIAILAALQERNRTGRGTWIDHSMHEGTASLQGMALAAEQLSSRPVPRGHGLLTGGAASYQVYPSKDGHFYSLAALEPKFWQSFLKAVGLQSQIQNGFEAAQFSTAWHRRLGRIFRTRTRRQWARVAQENDCCLTPLLSLHELAADEHLRKRKFFFKRVGPKGRKVAMMKLPFLFSGKRFFQRRRAARLGQQTHTILTSLGVNRTEMRKLRKKGAIQ